MILRLKYLRYRWKLSRLYDWSMRLFRGYGGFTGIARRGYPFMFWRISHVKASDRDEAVAAYHKWQREQDKRK